jgi:hypothetical protein
MPPDLRLPFREEAMRKVICFAAVLAAALGLALGAQGSAGSLTGDWDVSYRDGQGSHTALMRLEQTAEKVKGNVRGADIADGVIAGSVEGDRLAFAVRFYDNRGRLGSPTECTATLADDTLKGHCRQSGQDWAAKRKQ